MAIHILPIAEDVPIVKLGAGKDLVEVESQSLEVVEDNPEEEEDDQVDIQLVGRRTASSTW
jgi:hypothetical protein